MRKMFLAMVLVLMMVTGTAFADSVTQTVGAHTNTNTNTANGGAGGAGGALNLSSGAFGGRTLSPSAESNSTNLNTNLNTNTNVNTNVNTSAVIGSGNSMQGQMQGQGQLQGQINEGNNNSINIEAQKQNLVGLPSLGSVPELNFGNGKMTDATTQLPNFAIYGIKPLKSEAISEVLSVNANVKFKKLYAAVLKDARSVASNGGKTLSDIRYQVIRAEAQKSWNTGGSIGGGASGLANNGLGGGAGAASLVPSFGGTKADDLFTIIFVKVIP